MSQSVPQPDGMTHNQVFIYLLRSSALHMFQNKNEKPCGAP